LTGGKAQWVVIVGPRATLRLSGSLTDEAIKLQGLRLVGDAATLTASGSAARAAAGTSFATSIKDLQVRWQVGVADLGRISSDVAGDLKMSGQLSGSPASMAADADVTSSLSVRGSAPETMEAQVHLRGLPTAPSGTIQAHGM